MPCHHLSTPKDQLEEKFISEFCELTYLDREVVQKIGTKPPWWLFYGDPPLWKSDHVYFYKSFKRKVWVTKVEYRGVQVYDCLRLLR